jgi:hypothetical protein
MPLVLALIKYYATDCGHIGSGFQVQLTNGAKTTSEIAFPWYAAIFKKQNGGDYSFICGGSLIERSVIITAGMSLATIVIYL